jgi:plastocyanin
VKIWCRVKPVSAAWLIVAVSTSGANAEQPATGTIAGTVRYEFDARRPWRYGRIYVKKAGRETSGPLAEAVVCLAGRSLKNTAPAEAKTIVVDQKEMQFVPETTVLRAGDFVKFTNSDPSTHNVNSDHPLHRFNVTIGHGEEAVERFPRAGGSRVPVPIGCTFHGHMRAWIYVFDHPYFQLTGRDGQFRLEDVPAGEYRLEVVHPAGELRTSRAVVVPAGETLEVEFSLSPDNAVKAKP